MQIAVLGIDLGKNSCSARTFKEQGKDIQRTRSKRDRQPCPSRGPTKQAARLPVEAAALEQQDVAVGHRFHFPLLSQSSFSPLNGPVAQGNDLSSAAVGRVHPLACRCKLLI